MSRPSLRGKPQVLHCLKVMSLICLFEYAMLFVVVVGILRVTKSQEIIAKIKTKVLKEYKSKCCLCNKVLVSKIYCDLVSLPFNPSCHIRC